MIDLEKQKAKPCFEGGGCFLATLGAPKMAAFRLYLVYIRADGWSATPERERPRKSKTSELAGHPDGVHVKESMKKN